jgi:mannose/fructose-specific phosphotransferase system component IIA
MTDLTPGSIWREVDKRFTRHVRVMHLVGGTNPKVAIQTVSADDGRAIGPRITYAKADAFGRRYKLVSAAPQPAG